MKIITTLLLALTALSLAACAKNDPPQQTYSQSTTTTGYSK